MVRAGHLVLVALNAKDAYTRMGLTVGVHVPTISGAGSIGKTRSTHIRNISEIGRLALR